VWAMNSHPEKIRPKPIFWTFGPAISEVKCVNLALQGGSAHGAFTWGVLDRLLEEPRIEVEGVSATSAGAMNAAVMAHG
jgi:NTE family protein